MSTTDTTGSGQTGLAGLLPSGTAAATALGMVLLLSTLKIWLPSVSFIYGRVGSTPATELALFALIPFLLVAVLAFVVRLGRRTAFWAGLVLAVARLGLQMTTGTDSGDPQLWVATLGVVAGLIWLVAMIAHEGGRGGIGVGLMLGVAADAVIEVALGGTDLLWFDGAGPYLVLLFLVVGFRLALGGLDAEPAPRGSVGWRWVALGPLLMLHLVLTGTPTRVGAITSWPPVVVALLVAGAYAVAVFGAPHLRSSGVGPGPATAGVIVGGGALAHTGLGIPVAIGVAVLPLGLLAGLRTLDLLPGDAGERKRARGAALGLLLFFVLAFLYYGSYDIGLGFPNVLLLTTAFMIAAVVVGTVAAPDAPLTGRVDARAGAAAAVLVLLLGGAAWARTPSADTVEGDGFPVRVMTYNVHMGYDTDGRYAIPGLAAVIKAEEPDIVVLNEVDRGWVLNGSNDVLLDLARETGLSYTFAPAADAIWGNAVLSRFPVRDVEVTALPLGGAPMRRSAVSLIVELGGGQELGVVGTHLHHRDEDPDVREEQAVVVARIVDELAGSDRPVVLMGDMNAEPGDPELAPFADLRDVVTPAGDIVTYPSWDPDVHIDHVLVTSGLDGSDVSVPRSEASDHLGVAVTLSR